MLLKGGVGRVQHIQDRPLDNPVADGLDGNTPTRAAALPLCVAIFWGKPVSIVPQLGLDAVQDLKRKCVNVMRLARYVRP
jgi:hypothetical protein